MKAVRKKRDCLSLRSGRFFSKTLSFIHIAFAVFRMNTPFLNVLNIQPSTRVLIFFYTGNKYGIIITVLYICEWDRWGFPARLYVPSPQSGN